MRGRRAARGGAIGVLLTVTGCTAMTGADGLFTLPWEATGEDKDAGAGGRTNTPPSTPSKPETPEPIEPDPKSDDAASDASPGDGGVDGATRVFVLSTAVRGDLGGVGDADGLCSDRARAADLSGEWIAWLSTTSKNARDRMTSPGPYRLVDGTGVSASKAQLISGRLDHAIDIDERGARVTSGDLVWTGTRSDGTASAMSDSCIDWNPSPIQTGGSGRTGSLKLTDAGWTFGGTAPCTANARLYCFEKLKSAGN